MLKLRPYQQRDILEIRGLFARRIKRVVYVLATGGGKTIVFSFIVQSAAERGKRVLILAHRQEIIDQISAGLAGLDVVHGVIAPGYLRTDHAVQIASIATAGRRLREIGHFDLIIVDECHHAVSKMWRLIIEANSEAFVLGVTASPERLDGRPLDVFEEMVISSSDVAALMRDGHLASYELYAPGAIPDLSGVRNRAGDYAVDDLSHVMSQSIIIRAAADEYERHAWGEPAIAFCVDRQHSQAVTAAFVKRGHRAAHVDGETPAGQRRRLISALGNGELDVLCNCGLISEGVDIPAVKAAILARPTQSLAMHLQQVGRVLRVSPGKDMATILDLAGNTFRHGLPDTPRAWSLVGRGKKDRGPPPIVRRLRHCVECGALNQPGTAVCRCGAHLKPTMAERQDATLELIRVRQEQILRLSSMSYGECMHWAGESEERLQMVALARGYKPGFVHKRIVELNERGRSAK